MPVRKVGWDWLIAPKDLEEFGKKPQGSYKLTPDQIKQIKSMAREGTTSMQLAKKFKVPVRTIYRYMNK